ncbi:hypothetical protein HH212_05065 [Massilia forsythiae]|uniref:Uncharacterized protein n=1 Tax=Massilia forsythiae TaxID=2728020 RepID=A0A7Z2VU11_9BURK|nr:hypothetical protein [Massilia forsythiae]QJD99467.1 hypothetical protein HH212_05065 [Massilia forsythiae]
MVGYFLEIQPEKAAYDDKVYVGSLNEEKPGLCKCPNCGEKMFPVFSIHKSINGMPDLNFYDELGYVTMDVCPFCSHSLKNYFVRIDNGNRVAAGGYIDGNGPSNFIDTPFESRAVTLVAVAESVWNEKEFLEKYAKREILGGVRHQLKGKKIKNEVQPLKNCMCCGGKLEYFATIDYDDLNIPLYEKKEPRALIIGDMKSLNVMACMECGSLNYGITT